MFMLIVGLLLFLGVHSVAMVAPRWRDRMVTRLGETAYQGIYSLISFAGLALIVWGFGLARQAPSLVYVPPVWLRHLSLLLMVPVFPLFLAAYLPGRLRAWTGQHPMLAAVALWALAHLLANGLLAEVVLFGAFLVWALADRISMAWRQPLPVPGAPPGAWNDLIAVVGGLGLYGAFVLWLHPWLIGVPVVTV